MIARFNILLPFSLTKRADQALSPIQFVQDQYMVTLRPPVQGALTWADIDPIRQITFEEVISRIQPADRQLENPAVQLDGVPSLQANLLQIDFSKQDFDRAIILGAEEHLGRDDPPPQLAFDIANGLLTRIRAVARGCEVHTLDAKRTPWRVDYLGDDGQPLAPIEGLHRCRFGHHVSFQATALTAAFWEQIGAMPRDFAPWYWGTLLLDAEALLPDVDASIALANAALEAFGKWLLDQLAAQQSLPSGLWDWINNRGFFLKDPSVDDRFDPLLRAFTGKSLKDEPELWTAYKNLRQARNTFSHRGKPMIGDREVTVEVVTELIVKAKKIVDWCELLLPSHLQRPKGVPSVAFFNFLIPFGDFPNLPPP
jgi:hypothetical protein